MDHGELTKQVRELVTKKISITRGLQKHCQGIGYIVSYCKDENQQVEKIKL